MTIAAVVCYAVTGDRARNARPTRLSNARTRSAYEPGVGLPQSKLVGTMQRNRNGPAPTLRN